jgi:DNA repair protein RadD
MAGEGMYRTLLEGLRKVNPHVRVVGLTATPYRLKGGLICQPDHFLNAICYEVGVRELIDQGYLCPLRGKAGGARPDFSRLHLRGGEFIPGEVEQTMDRSELVRMAVAEIIELSENREAVLIFTAGVEHGRHVAEQIEQIANAECGFICGTTAALERETLIQRFKDGELKFLANVNVLTTGFDAPNVDTVVLLRPTNSTGLYYQMVGRGFRLSENKDDCLVLDYGDNILRHGPVDALNPKEPGRPTGREAPLKECPNCHELVHTSVRECPDCGHEFPIEARAPHQSQAAAEEVLSSDTTDASLAVTGVDYFVHTKRGAPPGSPQTMRVEYSVGLNEYVSEWVCPEHVGFARRKAEKWWSRRSAAPMPDSAAEAVELAEAGALAETHRIVVRQKEGDRFPRIIRHDLGPVPAAPEALPASPYTDPSFPWPDDDIPF